MRIKLFFCSVLFAAAQPPELLAQARSHQLEVSNTSKPEFELHQAYTLGTLDGAHDSFGRIMDAKFDYRGNLVVADDLNHRLVVFSPEGKFLRFVGRKGEGPGELLAPWRIAIDPADSLFVWDFNQATISVFGPDYEYVRNFRVSPHWLVASMSFLPNRNLLIAAFGRGESHPIHVLDRNGSHRDSFGPTIESPDLSGFEGSLLGGTIALSANYIAYANKSPYKIVFFDLMGKPVSQCIGIESWTTAPSDVVKTTDVSRELLWKKYIHVFNILNMGNDKFINVIMDPVNGRTIFDVITPDCILSSRQINERSLIWTDKRDGRIVGVRTIEYPEIIVYEVAN